MIDGKLFEGFDCLYIEGYLVQDHALIKRIASEADAAGIEVAIDLASFNVVEEEPRPAARRCPTPCRHSLRQRE